MNTLPKDFALTSLYPNPFNSHTSVAVSLPEASQLTVRVFNVLGQQVAELANTRFAAGEHRFAFDANGLSSGVYFVQATVHGHWTGTRKLLLVR